MSMHITMLPRDVEERRRTWCKYYQRGHDCICIFAKCTDADQCFYYVLDYNKKLVSERKAEQRANQKAKKTSYKESKKTPKKLSDKHNWYYF